MKGKDDIGLLLHKFILDQCNKEEIEKVVDFFRRTKSSDAFPTVEDVLQLLNEIPEMDSTVAEKIYQDILATPKGKKKTTLKTYYMSRGIWKYAVAAVFIGVMITGYFNQQLFLGTDNIPSMTNEGFITLELENGEIEIIKLNDSIAVVDAQGNVVGVQNGKQLVYNNQINSETLKYNTLKVPYGKRFELSLSDGTRVHLNAGTSFKYPVNFIKGQKRQVFLYGEAYFEVAEDKSRPFIVNTGELNVQVFGTKFNVSAYPENTSTNVVLVEGSVGLFMDGENINRREKNLLRPGFKGSFNKKWKTISKKEVETSIYTSWIDGKLVFKNLRFENIIRKLERHYNVAIINKNKGLTKGTYNANFGNEPIERVLQYLKISYDIEYSIHGNKIIIE